MDANNEDFIPYEPIERTLLIIRNCLAFKIPPMTSNEGYRAQYWPKNPIFEGRCRIVATEKTGRILLEHVNKGIFAVCNIYTDTSKPETVTPVLDSSRYFVLLLEDGKGKRAFIGLAFRTREDAFDFKVTLQDFHNQNKMELQPKLSEPHVDLSIPKGQTLHLNLKTKSSSPKIKDSSSTSTSNDLTILPPVSSKSKKNNNKIIISQPQPPLSNTNASLNQNDDIDWGDFNSFDSFEGFS